MRNRNAVMASCNQRDSLSNTIASSGLFRAGGPIIPLFKRKTAPQMVAVVFGGAPSGGQRHNNLGLSVPFVKHDAVVLSHSVKYFTLKPEFR